MYNLGVHAPGLPVGQVPLRWIMFWSDTLEADLQQRRLNAQAQRGQRRSGVPGRRR